MNRITISSTSFERVLQAIYEINNYLSLFCVSKDGFLNGKKIKLRVCKTAPAKLKFYPTQDRIALHFKTLMTKCCSYIDSLLCFKEI